MKCEIYAFDPREGGIFRICVKYIDSNHSVRGKTSWHSEVFRGRFPGP
jgi:hypothetical protein